MVGSCPLSVSREWSVSQSHLLVFLIHTQPLPIIVDMQIQLRGGLLGFHLRVCVLGGVGLNCTGNTIGGDCGRLCTEGSVCMKVYLWVILRNIWRLVSASRERGGGGENGSTQEEDWDMS